MTDRRIWDVARALSLFAMFVTAVLFILTGSAEILAGWGSFMILHFWAGSELNDAYYREQRKDGNHES